MRKRVLCLALCAVMLAAFAGCDMSIGSAGSGTGAVTKIELKGDKASVVGGGASVKGNEIVISAAGSFSVSGRLDNGRITVDTGDDPGVVTLTLCGADISNPDDAAIYVKQAKDVTVELAEGSQNTVSSGSAESRPENSEDANGAAIFAEDDILFSGSGKLTVNGNINNGITCKDDIKINGGEIVVTAENNGIKGSESVTVNDGVVTVNAGNDGIKATSADKAEKGYVTVNGGAVTINAVGDGISAETELNINGGVVNISTTGKASGESSKALKAKTGLNITGGVLELNSFDHAVHSTAGISISGGAFNIASADGKGIAAHGNIEISGGSFDINSISDGIETVGNINIENGSLNIISGSEGIRAGESNSDVGDIVISGGAINISACGDGMDAKGGLFVSGGSVLAIGNSKKPKSFDEGSTQPFVAAALNGGTEEKLTVSDGGNELGSCTSKYSFNSVLFSSEALKSGAEYTVSTLRETLILTAK